MRNDKPGNCMNIFICFRYSMNNRFSFTGLILFFPGIWPRIFENKMPAFFPGYPGVFRFPEAGSCGRGVL
jgi:hypothetical protein